MNSCYRDKTTYTLYNQSCYSLRYIEYGGMQILRTKKAGFARAVPLIFWNLCPSPLQKIWSYRFPWKTSSDQSKTFTTNLPNFTEFHRRKPKKIHCQFCFLCSCWRNKVYIEKHWRFLWACADYFLSARAIVKLKGATFKFLGFLQWNSVKFGRLVINILLKSELVCQGNL